MVIHNWGNDKVDWKGISDAAWFLASNLKRWGRVPVTDFKEKWGTVRVYCGFGWSSLHDLTHPGHHWIRYPEPFKRLYYKSLSLQWYIFKVLNYVVVPYHKWLYTHLYGRALKKWPHLREEILTGADWGELLHKYGVHLVRDGERSYIIHHDWHPDNYTVRFPEKKEEEEGSDEQV